MKVSVTLKNINIYKSDQVFLNILFLNKHFQKVNIMIYNFGDKFNFAGAGNNKFIDKYRINCKHRYSMQIF